MVPGCKAGKDDNILINLEAFLRSFNGARL